VRESDKERVGMGKQAAAELSVEAKTGSALIATDSQLNG